ncbi:hypothetical protein L5515_009588 [Caenorhabditis briggsae]|uniref:Uncharacterized protein n=1 Tax=Caenorhabditis briggsae TaxID=6238 RepID=A0AAE9F951_CAEBR|nr:hypothetical protein L5515_009588 [Caenorhabditis briggsae]
MRPHEMNQFLIYCILFLFVMLILSIVLLFVSRPIYKFKAKYFPGEQDYEMLKESNPGTLDPEPSSLPLHQVGGGGGDALMFL